MTICFYFHYKTAHKVTSLCIFAIDNVPWMYCINILFNGERTWHFIDTSIDYMHISYHCIAQWSGRVYDILREKWSYRNHSSLNCIGAVIKLLFFLWIFYRSREALIKVHIECGFHGLYEHLQLLSWRLCKLLFAINVNRWSKVRPKVF